MMIKKPDTMPVCAVVLIGGKGKRLMPLSTENRPKAFLSVTRDRKTMFRRTVDRVHKLIPYENIIVVANESHAKLAKKDVPDIDKKNIFLEPVSRNTAPAIFLAASLIRKMHGDSVVVVLPTDQYIKNEKRYVDAVRRGINFIKSADDAIVVIGIKPDRPETGFGYIKRSEVIGDRSEVCKVERFIEKPDIETAKRYFLDGKYLWNTGAFIFKASTILRAMDEFIPEISLKLDPEDAAGSYGELPDISIDYAVIEKAGNVYCLKGSFGWMDMGNFENLKKILKIEGRKFIERDGKVVKII